MALDVRRVDGKRERSVLLGMILDDHVLALVAPQWNNNRFPSRMGNLVGAWCVEYHNKYHRAPKSDIKGIFDRWAEINRDREMIELIESLLRGLSDEAARSNIQTDYLVDMAADLFEATQLKDLADRIQANVETGRTKDALELISTYRKLGVGSSVGKSELTDDDGMLDAFNRHRECLIEYPGAMGEFFKNSLGRDQFVAVMAAEKRGKSTVLLDMAWRAVEQKRNTAWFVVGDMSEWQVKLRLASRRCQRPVEAGKWEVPTSLEGAAKYELPKVESEWRRAKEDLTYEEEEYQRRSWIKKVGPDRLKLSCHGAASVVDLEGELNLWAHEGWSPSVVIIDYADNLSPITAKFERRDQINETWRAMRTLSQKWHCLVITATQADAASYDSWILKRSNFSEDKRKYGHVTSIFGYNVSAKEKTIGSSRLNWLANRDLAFPEETYLWCAGCFAFYNPFMLATF